MPPELKKVIASIDEMTCNNCIFSHTPNTQVCCNPDSPDWFIDNNEVCSKGQWRMSVAQNRVSTNCFEVCYDYLAEKT